MTLRWPSMLPKTSVMFHQAMASRSGGRAINGSEQVVVSTSGFWRAKISFMVLRKAQTADQRKQDMQLVWRALLASIQGRSNAFLIGPCDHGNTPAYIAGDTVEGDPVPHDDDTFFSDGTGYVHATTPSEVVGDVDVGSTSMTMDMLAGHTPEPGMYFSVNERMFVIETAEETDTADQWDVTVWPETREVIFSGAAADFDDPVCLMRFASDDTGELPIQKLMASMPSLDLVEASPNPSANAAVVNVYVFDFSDPADSGYLVLLEDI